MNKDKINILIATGIYPPSIGGPASYSKLLADRLPEFGFSVRVLSFDEVRKYPKGISHFLYFLKMLKKSKGIDIIYAQDPVSVGLPVMIASKIMRKRYILKIVGDYAWEQGVSRFGVEDNLDQFVTKKQKNIFVRFLQWIETLVAGGATRIIVPSKYLKRVVENWGVFGKKITVVYNAFNKPDFENIISAKDSDEINIISVGRLVPWKGFSLLIDVVDNINKRLKKDDVKEVTLTIVGSGPERLKLSKKIKNKEIKNIKLTGQMEQGDLYKEISNNDIFVLNTGYEGFSHLILEVMAIGIPVITTKVGGNVEMIKDNKNGLLVEYNNKEELKNSILDLMKNKQKRVMLAKEARENVMSYTENKMLSSLEKELKKIL